MSPSSLDSVVDRLLPQILADPDLGNGRVFTRRHFRHLWALSCLQIGQWYNEELLASCLPAHLPPQVAYCSEPNDEEASSRRDTHHDDTPLLFKSLRAHQRNILHALFGLRSAA
jgi:hypothetical protein